VNYYEVELLFKEISVMIMVQILVGLKIKKGIVENNCLKRGQLEVD